MKKYKVKSEQQKIVVSGVFNHVRQYLINLKYNKLTEKWEHITADCPDFYGFTFNSIEEAKSIMADYQNREDFRINGLQYEVIQIQQIEKIKTIKTYRE